MRKLVLLLPMLLFAEADKNPDKVTEEDLKLMKVFEKRIYMHTKLSGQKESRFEEILDFIKKHKISGMQAGKLKIKLQGSTGYKNYAGIDNNEKTYYQIGILVSYNILDKKEEHDLKMRKMKFDQEIAQNVAQYFRTKNALNALIKELQMLRLIERRSKVRVKSGIENLDNRLKLMQQILSVNEKINEERVNLFKLKALLVTYVEDSAKDELREMLQ